MYGGHRNVRVQKNTKTILDSKNNELDSPVQNTQIKRITAQRQEEKKQVSGTYHGGEKYENDY